MTETIIFALICSKIKKYKIKELFKSWTIMPLMIMMIINLLGQAMIFNGNYKYVEFSAFVKTFYIMSCIPLVFKYRIYIQSIIGSVCIFIGSVLNDIAIKANGGYMPVFPSLSYYTGYASKESFSIVKDIHILGTDTTKLAFLTDYIDLGYCILSIGDVFIRVFVFIVIFYSAKSSSMGKEKLN